MYIKGCDSNCAVKCSKFTIETITLHIATSV